LDINRGEIVARTRTIDRDAVLAAAERVVARDGATRLTLEAVAAEAGISKASVLYDYKTKQALIKAVIEHRVSTEMSRLRAFIDKEGDKPNAAILGRLAAADRRFSDAERNVALELSAALNQHQDLRRSIQNAFSQLLDEVERTSDHPRRARVLFLALEGLSLMECFGFCAWSEPERAQLLADIRAMIVPDTPATV
jgi:AcrR family transcriptional regulator